MNNDEESGREASSPLIGEPTLDELSNQQPDVDRAAALRAGRTPISPKFILWTIVAFAVLGLGGALLQHFNGNVGLPTTATIPFKSSTTTTPIVGQSSSSSLSEFLGLRDIGTIKAPGFSLRDQMDQKWSLSSAKGNVVVLAFYNMNCNDICPVLGAEIKQARQLLGVNASKVDFTIVNTDPKHLSVSAKPLALSVPGLLASPEINFVTGPLAALNAVWTHYGISIKVGANSNDVTHNNLMYFISPSGELSAQVDPFASVNSVGAVTLDAKEVHRFALGISRVADSLIK
jgi:protein SCO1/2